MTKESTKAIRTTVWETTFCNIVSGVYEGRRLTGLLDGKMGTPALDDIMGWAEIIKRVLHPLVDATESPGTFLTPLELGFYCFNTDKRKKITVYETASVRQAIDNVLQYASVMDLMWRCAAAVGIENRTAQPKKESINALYAVRALMDNNTGEGASHWVLPMYLRDSHENVDKPAKN